MKIYIHGNDAFVNVGSGYLLCIGTKEEVKKANYQTIMEMVEKAKNGTRWIGTTDFGNVVH